MHTDTCSQLACNVTCDQKHYPQGSNPIDMIACHWSEPCTTIINILKQERQQVVQGTPVILSGGKKKKRKSGEFKLCKRVVTGSKKKKRKDTQNTKVPVVKTITKRQLRYFRPRSMILAANEHSQLVEIHQPDLVQQNPGDDESDPQLYNPSGKDFEEDQNSSKDDQEMVVQLCHSAPTTEVTALSLVSLKKQHQDGTEGIDDAHRHLVNGEGSGDTREGSIPLTDNIDDDKSVLLDTNKTTELGLIENKYFHGLVTDEKRNPENFIEPWNRSQVNSGTVFTTTNAYDMMSFRHLYIRFTMTTPTKKSHDTASKKAYDRSLNSFRKQGRPLTPFPGDWDIANIDLHERRQIFCARFQISTDDAFNCGLKCPFGCQQKFNTLQELKGHIDYWSANLRCTSETTWYTVYGLPAHVIDELSFRLIYRLPNNMELPLLNNCSEPLHRLDGNLRMKRHTFPSEDGVEKDDWLKMEFDKETYFMKKALFCLTPSEDPRHSFFRFVGYKIKWLNKTGRRFARPSLPGIASFPIHSTI